jgi:SnoaL-like polyketide cyclase
MSVEQVARDLITEMTDVEKTRAHLTADAMASGGVLPQPMPAMEAFSIIGGLMTAFPDLKFEVEDVTVNGNQARVNARVSGTNTGPLSLPMPGMPSNMPPTGKKVSAKDTFVVTVDGDKVSHLQVDSPPGGGLPALLAQLS